MQKFKKIGDAFRHFDRNFDNEVSFKEFRIVCEEMDLRYTSDEIRELFDYLDSDGGGSIGYVEFTKLLDEKRRGLDPFINKQSNNLIEDQDSIHKMRKFFHKKEMEDEMEIFEKRKNLFDVEAFKGKCQNNIKDMKTDLLACTSSKLANYKFKKIV